jgi:uncharacterized iron-regulated membrane protein
MDLRAIFWLSWFHRWTGILVCLFFALWFATGAVLLFAPFPGLSDPDKLAGAAPVAMDQVKLSPAEALAKAGGGETLRLVTDAGLAVYVAKPANSPFVAINAATGEKVAPITAEAAAQVAAAWSARPIATVSKAITYDQWVVHQQFDPWRPLYRVSLAGDDGEQVYVSARTGEVVQRTFARERGWNWVGANVHWIYFTVLRQSFTAWDQTVWWISLVGLTTAVVGTFLGLYRTQKKLQGRTPNWSPFRGWLRWHHGLGLGVALFVLSWIFSGWLSMDHGRLFSRGEAQAIALDHYHGAPLAAALSNTPTSALADLTGAGRINFSVVGGHPIAAGEFGGAPPKVQLLDQATPAASQIPANILTAAAADAWPLADSTLRGSSKSDAFYRAAEELPGRAVSLTLTSPKHALLYLDPVTGEIKVLMDTSRKAYAWCYYALHTFNFPWLLDHPVLRKVLILIPLLAGFLFSITGLVVGYRRLRDSFRRPA